MDVYYAIIKLAFSTIPIMEKNCRKKNIFKIYSQQLNFLLGKAVGVFCKYEERRIAHNPTKGAWSLEGGRRMNRKFQFNPNDNGLYF